MTSAVALPLSVAWYTAALLLIVGAIGIVRPIPRLALPSRQRAAITLAAALVVMVILAVWPPPLTQVASPTSRLDEIAPAYHYTEVHERHVNAPPDRVYAAMKQTTASEIALFETFTWIRRFGQPLPDTILNAPANTPILDVATRGGFALCVDDRPRELVVTARVAPRVTAAMNFRIEADGGGSRLRTETRVVGEDAAAIRPFTPYWRTILPGSWILRVTWLNAIARRAELN
jgi:hypothetical protein